MAPDPLDDVTAEWLLRGGLPPDDVPPGYGGVATLLEAARAEARITTSARADVTIAAMAAAIRTHGQRVRKVRTVRTVHDVRPVPRRRRLRAKAAVGASTGFLALFGSLAAAGALPSVAQDQVSTVLAKVGINVPRADTPDPGTAKNHGACVSEVAGSGGVEVSGVAQSDCGKPPTVGGAPADHQPKGNGPPGGAPPGQVKPHDPPQPTPPPQSNSGGSAGEGQGNGHGQGAKPEAPGRAEVAPPPSGGRQPEAPRR